MFLQSSKYLKLICVFLNMAIIQMNNIKYFEQSFNFNLIVNNYVSTKRMYSTLVSDLNQSKNNDRGREIRLDVNEVINYLNSYWVQNYECDENGFISLVKDEYRGFQLDKSFGVICLKENEFLKNLPIDERRKLEKINYLFCLPLQEELINHFPFFLGEYTFFYFYIDLSANERYAIDAFDRATELHFILSSYKDLIFNYQYLTSVRSYGKSEENEDSYLFEQNQLAMLELILCFPKGIDKTWFLDDFHSRLKEFFEKNKKTLIHQEYELIELIKPQDFFIFFKREYIFKKYPFECFRYYDSINSFFIYEFRTDLLPYYHLLGFNCDNDEADLLNVEVYEYCRDRGYVYDYKESVGNRLAQIEGMNNFISFVDCFVYIPSFFRSLNRNGKKDESGN